MTMSAQKTTPHAGDQHINFAARANRAFARGQAGDSAGAAAAYAELLPSMLRVLGPDHRETLAVRAHLAWWRFQVSEDLKRAFAS